MLFEVSILEENKVTSNVTANRMDNKQPYAISNCHLMCINVLTLKIEKKQQHSYYILQVMHHSLFHLSKVYCKTTVCFLWI